MLKILYAYAVSSHFGTIHSWNVRRSRKLPKNTEISYRLRFKVIDVDTIQKLVTSACYDKQHVYAYMQLFSR